MSTFFTAWGYEVSYLEFVSALTSFIGVWYGTTTKRITWPWCRKNLGPGGYLVNDLCVWKIDTMFGNSTFAFKHEKHYTWFILRWGNDQETE